MEEKSENSGNIVQQTVSSGRDAMTVNGSYQSNATTTQNFWISLSIIGTISIGTLIGTASLIFYAMKDRDPLETGFNSQPTLSDRSLQEG